MSDSTPQVSEQEVTSRTLETVIRIGLVALLLVWCFRIVEPFAVPMIWGVVLAIAVFPAYARLLKLLGGREKPAAALYTLITLALLITPAVMIAGSFIETSRELLQGLNQGTLEVPPPGPEVKGWPLVGEELYAVWSAASLNLEETLKQYGEQIRGLVKSLLSAAAGAGQVILQFVVAIVISGVLLAKSEGAVGFTLRLFQRLCGEKTGTHFSEITGLTIRSVAHGVIGVALIQALLIGIGLYWMSVPGWGFWTFLVLVFAVAQLPVVLVLIPVIAYVFSTAEPTPAIVFTIWSLIVGISDSFLKPLFLGRGLETPMLVILLGAIGGMLLSGILGLFVGAVVLALGYELFMAWLKKGFGPSDPSV